MRSFLVTVGAIAILTGSTASAQDKPSPAEKPLFGEDFPVFAHVNFGFQGQDGSFGQSAEFQLYDDVGSWNAGHDIDGGATFDIGGGLRLAKFSRVLRNVSVGVTFTSRAKHTRDVPVDARVPHPFIEDIRRETSVSLGGFEHSERAVHIQALWHVPVTLEFDVTLFAGPSIFSVRDEIIESITAVEVGQDLTDPNAPVGLENSRSRQRHSAGGFHLGVDTRYTLFRNLSVFRDVGVGAMLRYSRGSADFTLPNGTTQELDAGGPEFAAGLRLRF